MIAKNIDVKLNVRPIYIGLVHEYAYEGPCRFGAVSYTHLDVYKRQVSHLP